MQIQTHLNPVDLRPAVERLFALAAAKVVDLDRKWKPERGTPVFTVRGRYTTRGWTEWTQGFQYGCAILAYDVTNEPGLLELGRSRTIERMTPHLSHIGVHDHGFNTISTYGNLRRLVREHRIDDDPWQLRCYEQAIQVSGAVQAGRWSTTSDGGGYIYSFNGPQSLFIDTMRSLRVLVLADRLGHVLMGENDESINLLGRAITHGLTTARHNVYFGQGRDAYDIAGRVVHESIFNRNDGRYRCPSTQQGYSPFSTWTRGLAWAMLGYAEQLEVLQTIPPRQVKAACGLAKSQVLAAFEAAARATCEFYVNHATAADGVPYWDTGAPGLVHLDDWQNRAAEPYNDHEPVDSSAAAIAGQGLIRLGRYLERRRSGRGRRFIHAGLTVAQTIMDEPYLSVRPTHQGLLLHSIYHRPNGWDYIPRGRKSPCGESSMWGDYHLLELAHLIHRLAERQPYPTFFGPSGPDND